MFLPITTTNYQIQVLISTTHFILNLIKLLLYVFPMILYNKAKTLLNKYIVNNEILHMMCYTSGNKAIIML
jgi:hypothetical protein